MKNIKYCFWQDEKENIELKQQKRHMNSAVFTFTGKYKKKTIKTRHHLTNISYKYNSQHFFKTPRQKLQYAYSLDFSMQLSPTSILILKRYFLAQLGNREIESKFNL